MSQDTTFSPLFLYQAVALFFEKFRGADRACEFLFYKQISSKKLVFKILSLLNFLQFFYQKQLSLPSFLCHFTHMHMFSKTLCWLFFFFFSIYLYVSIMNLLVWKRLHFFLVQFVLLLQVMGGWEGSGMVHLCQGLGGGIVGGYHVFSTFCSVFCT